MFTTGGKVEILDLSKWKKNRVILKKCRRGAFMRKWRQHFELKLSIFVGEDFLFSIQGIASSTEDQIFSRSLLSAGSSNLPFFAFGSVSSSVILCVFSSSCMTEFTCSNSSCAPVRFSVIPSEFFFEIVS